MSSHFTLLYTSLISGARAGILHTPHGDVETPVFMPVGTQASVKGVSRDLLTQLGAQIILSNTYHLALRPGTELIQKMGGLHQFMQWDKPILTDSGGFQVFSLTNIRKIVSEGVIFNSHLDGSKQLFTPENVVNHQLSLGSDIMMPLDICTPYGATYDDTLRDVDQTTAWAQTAREHWETCKTNTSLYGIVQGGMFLDLRKKSAEELIALDFPGYAIGGVSVGEPEPLLNEQLQFTAPLLPVHKPRYAMGIGRPENFDIAIRAGIDMFDCVLPTRLARHAQVFTSFGKLNIRNLKFREDESALDPGCDCMVCTTYSRAYLRHLIIAKEMLGLILLSYHNVYYLVHYVSRIREGILKGEI